jgi:hypothetical protein
LAGRGTVFATSLIVPKGGPIMVASISRDELKQKLDRGDRFVLVETLPEFMY